MADEYEMKPIQGELPEAPILTPSLNIPSRFLSRPHLLLAKSLNGKGPSPSCMRCTCVNHTTIDKLL